MTTIQNCVRYVDINSTQEAASQDDTYPLSITFHLQDYSYHTYIMCAYLLASGIASHLRLWYWPWDIWIFPSFLRVHLSDVVVLQNNMKYKNTFFIRFVSWLLITWLNVIHKSHAFIECILTHCCGLVTEPGRRWFSNGFSHGGINALP